MDIRQDKSVKKIISQLKSAKNDGPVKVAGTWGSFAPMLAVNCAGCLKKPLVYISAHLDDADNTADDMTGFGAEKVDILPGWAGQEVIDATDQINAVRSRIILKTAGGRKKSQYPKIISTSIQAITQPVQKAENLFARGLNLEVGKTITMASAAGWLVDNGFEPVAQVDMAGQFAKRGGIIDIFAPVTTASADSQAVRIEFFGDEIESIRPINLETQRSVNQINSITICPVFGEGDGKTSSAMFLDLIDKDTIIFVEEPNTVAEIADTFLSRVENPKNLYNRKQIFKKIAEFKHVFISRFAGDDKTIELKIKSTQQFEHSSGPIWSGHRQSLAEIVAASQDNQQVYLYCENSAETKRIREILSEDKITTGKNFHLLIGFIHRGFIIEELKTIIVTHHELFGQSIIRRATRPRGAYVSVDSFAELNRGDYVVHINYGIGKFKGIEIIEKNGKRCEFLTLQYAEKTTIYVPVQNISLVQKYIGTTGLRPTLSKIGTKKWEQQKQKVAASTAELASELLENQAKRQSLGGIAFGADTKWQREFEQSFAYTETTDQITAIEQIKSDMQQPRPMDRLLCGDVGYGKTELAMRAAFKAVESGKQVAILVPTTVLCIQHERTFRERFTDFPMVVESLNRFKTKKQAADIIERTKKGQVDILIGTHRLLSKDVNFKDLGFLIIDEEQRFGVGHKEKLKKIKVNLDVLTMTATPIPRTLHMALLGLRDISSLATPPLDRRAVVSKVKKFDAHLIKNAITLELNRQGQIFFVHNRVQTIEKFANELHKIVPDLKISVAHGQMPKQKLERAMIEFVLGKIDILLCSTIIESGIDIPNANTIIINDADRFGLAQLHQLRGRVGRFKHKAYAYFLLPRSRTTSPIATKRLKAIEEYSQLGSGFKIALRDLEIRGAGNILGPEQSGHINTVGYELFCRLLSDAVKRLKNEPVEKELFTVIDLGFSTYIPKNYIPSDSQRMNIYRKIAETKTSEDLDRLGAQIADMFGAIPEQVQKLIDIAEIRLLARDYGICSIIADKCDLVFSFESGSIDRTAELFAKSPGSVRIVDPKTIYVRLDKKFFVPGTLLAILRKILRKKR